MLILSRIRTLPYYVRNLIIRSVPSATSYSVFVAFKSRQCVYDEYMHQRLESLKLGQMETLPEISFEYMVWCWKYSSLARKIVIRKCLRFAICDECIG